MMKIVLIVVGVIAVLILIAWVRGCKWRVAEKWGRESFFRMLAAEHTEKAGTDEMVVLTDKAFRTVSDDVYEKASPEKKKRFDKDMAKERERFKKQSVKFLRDEGMAYEEATEMVEHIVGSGRYGCPNELTEKIEP